MKLFLFPSSILSRLVRSKNRSSFAKWSTRSRLCQTYLQSLQRYTMANWRQRVCFFFYSLLGTILILYLDRQQIGRQNRRNCRIWHTQRLKTKKCRTIITICQSTSLNVNCLKRARAFITRWRRGLVTIRNLVILLIHRMKSVLGKNRYVVRLIYNAE